MVLTLPWKIFRYGGKKYFLMIFAYYLRIVQNRPQMIYWLIYLLVILYFCYLFTLNTPTKFKLPIFVLIFVAFMTPSTIELGSDRFGPSFFIFFYDLVLEQNLSFRSLRPLVISIPLALLFLIVLTTVKKRIFWCSYF